MPSYKKIVSFCLIIHLLSGCSFNFGKDVENRPLVGTKEFKKSKLKKYDLENAYILFALEYENQKAYKQAREVYYSLFENTNNYEYLVKSISLSFIIKDYTYIDKVVSSIDYEDVKEEETVLKVYSFALLRLNKQEEAFKYANKLVHKFPKDLNYELLGTMYLDIKDYLPAYLNFKKAYSLSAKKNVLITLSGIQYHNLKQKELAKIELQKYIDKNGYDYEVCIQLLSFYEVEKENEKIISMLKDMYYSYKENNEKVPLTRTKSLLINYLAKKDVYEAIKFLEENDEEELFLLNLYRNNGMYLEAYNLLEKLYLKTDDLNYLAQQAIIEFETAENRDLVLDSVIKKFEKVVEKISNPTYENYLAYILIDYDKDVKRGLEIIKKVLMIEPENSAFIDTLAWGEYKVGNCEEALKNMKKVVDKEGLADSEIKLHWEKIKECKK